MYKKLEANLKKNPNFNAGVHFLIGAGVGILITYPIVQSHPLRWGVAFIVAGLAGLLFSSFSK